MNQPTIVFLQNSSNLAGAQKCLLRLLRSPRLNTDFRLKLLVGERGWLTDACDRTDVDWHLLPFPSSRSLAGRLWENGAFVRRARAHVLADCESTSLVIHGNDHPESLLALGLARSIGCPSVLTLRTPGMSGRDFAKYQCDQHDALISVGDTLFEQVNGWNSGAPHSLVHDGIASDELLPLPAPEDSLEKVAVIGSLTPRKGWRDLIDALVLLETRGSMSFPKLVFVGTTDGLEPEAVLGLDRLKHCNVEFAGVVENFSEVIREFPLVIHPSRSESFGMAALETVATGAPLAAAATGLIPAFVPNRRFLFSPADVAEMAAVIAKLLQRTPAQLQQDFDFPTAQKSITNNFTLDQTVNQMIKIYDTLLKCPTK